MSITMNQTSSDPDPWQSISEPKIEQSTENAPGNIKQQAVIGDGNSQNQSVKDEKVECVNQQRQPVEAVTGQQAANGSDNNQNINQNSINNVINVTNINDVTGEDASVKESRNQKFIDPTKPLPKEPEGLPEINLDSLSSYCKKLQEDCLIIVTCSDDNSALSVAYKLSEKILVQNRRFLTGEWGTPKKLTVEPSIDTLSLSEIGEGEPTLIVVDAYEMQTFLDSLVVRKLAAESIKEGLRSAQKICICLADSESLRTTLERKKVKLFFPHWEIPFQGEEIGQDLPKGNKNQDSSFYADGQVAILLYENSDALRRIVLYVATFFESLNLTDFDRVVSLLLGDQAIISDADINTQSVVDPESIISVKVGDQTVIFNQSQEGQSNKELELSKTQTKRLLREIWREDTDKILAGCLLDFTVNKYSSKAIDFSLPHIQDELKKYFESKRFAEHRNRFQKLIELNLLFDTSSQVARAVRDLSVIMMRFQPGVNYWVDWLLQITLKVLEADSDKSQEKSEHIYYCLSDLLRETLDHSQLEDLTENFLEQLVALKQHSTVLAISKHLRFAPQFDEYYWLEQSIKEGNEEVRQEAYQLLYKQAKQSGSRIYETLERVFSWLPSLEQDQNTYSTLNKYALRFLLEYLLETLGAFDKKLHGDKAFSYPLFGGLQSDELINDKLNMVVRWLLHPGINSIFDKSRYQVDSLALVSIVIFPGLFTILFGLGEEVNVKPEFNHVVEALLQAINDVTRIYQKEKDINYFEEIVQWWRNLSKYLLDHSTHEIRVNNNWSQGAVLNYKRTLVDYLIERLEP